jgi:hypothetical protein
MPRRVQFEQGCPLLHLTESVEIFCTGNMTCPLLLPMTLRTCLPPWWPTPRHRDEGSGEAVVSKMGVRRRYSRSIGIHLLLSPSQVTSDRRILDRTLEKVEVATRLKLAT